MDTPQRRSSNGLVWWLAVQAGLSSLSGAAIMADVIGPKWAGLFLAVTGACNVGTAAYVAATRPVREDSPTKSSVG